MPLTLDGSPNTLDKTMFLIVFSNISAAYPRFWPDTLDRRLHSSVFSGFGFGGIEFNQRALLSRIPSILAGYTRFGPDTLYFSRIPSIRGYSAGLKSLAVYTRLKKKIEFARRTTVFCKNR